MAKPIDDAYKLATGTSTGGFTYPTITVPYTSPAYYPEIALRDEVRLLEKELLGLRDQVQGLSNIMYELLYQLRVANGKR